MKTGRKCTICKLEPSLLTALEKDFLEGVTRKEIAKIYNISYWALTSHLKNHFVAHPLTERVLVEEESGDKQSETQQSSVALNQNIDREKSPDDEPDDEPEPDPYHDMRFQPLPMPDPALDLKVKRSRRAFAEWMDNQGTNSDPYTSSPEPTIIG